MPCVPCAAMASPTRSEDSPATPGELAALATFLGRSGIPLARQDQIFLAAFAGTARQPHNTQGEEETASATPQVSGEHHERGAGPAPAYALPAQEPPQTALEGLPCLIEPGTYSKALVLLARIVLALTS